MHYYGSTSESKSLGKLCRPLEKLSRPVEDAKRPWKQTMLGVQKLTRSGLNGVSERDVWKTNLPFSRLIFYKPKGPFLKSPLNWTGSVFPLLMEIISNTKFFPQQIPMSLAKGSSSLDQAIAWFLFGTPKSIHQCRATRSPANTWKALWCMCIFLWICTKPLFLACWGPCFFRSWKHLLSVFFWDAAFLLTVGSFLLTVELFYLQLTILACLPTIGAFLLTIWALLLTVGASLLTVGKCV